MTISQGQTVLASDFIKKSERDATPANDSGRGIRLESNGKLATEFISQFGGTGADGALSIAAGTTTIDCANAAVVVKNYTSLSITGTGALAFSNPHANGTVIIFLIQGNCTITSSATPAISLIGMGAAAGVGGTGGGSPTNGRAGGGGASALNDGADGSGTLTNTPGTGTDGSDGIGFGRTQRGFGGGVVTVANADPRNWSGLGYGGKSPKLSTTVAQYLGTLLSLLIPGAGGGGGSALSNNAGGDGGRGAGSMYLQVGGTYTFTTGSIVGSGSAGGDPGSGSPEGGGGAAGMFLVDAAIMSTDSGTYTFTGGDGPNLAGDGGDGAALRRVVTLT